MCGIAGIHRRGSKQIRLVNKLSDNLLLEILERGGDATGFMAMLASGKVQMEKAAMPADRFVGRRKQISPAARSVLLHTRWATVGSAKDPRNAHPVVAGHVAAIHNGTIMNHREVFDVFGLKRTAEVDSEVIPAIVNHAGWEHAADALSLLTGGMATAIVTDEKPDEVILARLRSYPLVVLVTKDVVVWASTKQAIQRAWQKTYGTPARGRWIVMKDFTLIRLNGKVGEPEPIKQLPPERPKARPKVSVYAGGPAVSKRARRKARKASRQAHTRPYVPATPLLDDLFEEPEPYMDAAVADLMRAGYDRDTANDMVYGFTPDWEIEDGVYVENDNPFSWRDEFDAVTR